MTGSVPPVDPDVLREVFPFAQEEITRYVQLLATAGVERGLIGPGETDRLWERHVFNSAALADLVPGGADVVDVGSGAGLPGIPLALRRPELTVTLLEPLLRRATFLNEVVEALDLADRVTVVRARAEDHGATYDVVASRALAPLPRLLGWCLPLLAPGGRVLAVKGRSAQDEVDAVARDLVRQRLTADVLQVQAYPGADPATFVQVRRG